MASKKTVNLANLEALGAKRLAEILLELGMGDAGVKRRFRQAAYQAAAGSVCHRLGKASSFREGPRSAAPADRREGSRHPPRSGPRADVAVHGAGRAGLE